MSSTSIEALLTFKWNTTLPPVGVNVLVALTDGTVWKVKRESWVQTYKSDPCYRCVTTGHPLKKSDVLGWRYP